MSDSYSRMLTGLLRASHLTTFEQLPAVVAQHARQAGFAPVRMYVSDLREYVLREVTGVGLDAAHGGRS
ncbi:hypothetical protein [Streptomyces virginiae]|uniref:hypothetical protein n=1 Tax=Streptomyces virginiae TaxID=1961 RepID=UPI0036FAC21B